jgi:hypothetical protein
LSKVYFDVVHAEIGFLDQNDFNIKCKQTWFSSIPEQDYGGIIAGVVALGSFFSDINANEDLV